MRPLERLASFGDAERAVHDAVRPTSDLERVPVAEAAGRVLGEDVVAPVDVPPFDRSMMDGYAVRSYDTQGASEAAPSALRMAATVHAGALPDRPLGPRECLQVATGAPLPAGADAVVMVERTRREGERVLVKRSVAPGENVGRRGNDLAAGSKALATGTLLAPARLGVLSALGLTHVQVFRTPRVLLVSNGSELRRPGERLGPAQIYDSNSTSLRALLTAHGARVDATGIVPDDPEALARALETGRGHDLVLVTGSSSAGERDHLVDALQGRASILLHGVRVKPGKPLLLARLGPTPLVGLPGNPASCLLLAYVLVVPALRRFQRLPAEWARRVPAVLAHPVDSPNGRRQFLPVRVRDGRAESAFKESDATTSLAHADGYMEIPDDVERLEAGTPVDVLLF